MGNTITIRDTHDRYAATIDRVEWEIGELEYEERELLEKLKVVRRDLRQLRDTHELEGAR